MMIPGNSGFSVSMGQGPDSAWVIKRALNHPASERLNRQMHKQAHQRSGMRFPPDVSIPYVERRTWDTWLVGKIDGLHLFELEDPGMREAGMDRLLEVVSRYVVQSEPVHMLPKLFRDKAKQMIETCDDNHTLVNQALAKQAQKLIGKITDQLCGTRARLMMGPCHGDLTFGNVLFDKQGMLWLFDFLDTFVQSPVLDLVKLRQDTLLGWSLLRSGSSEAMPDWWKQLDEQLMEYVRRRSWAREWFPQMSAFNLARVFQYAKEDEMLQWLIKAAEEELCLTF